MSINCANITSKEYNKLKAKFGEDKANYLWNKLNGTIPEDISKLIPIEFKKAQVLMPHTLVKTLAENGIDVYKLTHEELQKVVSPEVLEGLSYRIPNQAAASNDAFEIVGILPENAGDTIIAFKEITTKTGSDFDIDKAFIMLPNYYYDKETKRLEIYKDDSKEGLENKRLSIANKMLSTIPNYIKLMKPLDTKWLENLVFGTKEKVGLFNNNKKAQDLDFFTGTNQVKTKSTFDNGKTLVGPIAKTMTNHNAVKHEGIKWSKWFIGKGIFEETTEETIIEETAPTNILNENGTIVNRFAEEVDAKYELFPGVFANNGQREALDKITDFLDSSKPEFLLMGKGGTGKTTIIKKILDKLPKEKVIGIAPSHKAKKVLGKSINTDKKKYKTTTLASALAIKLNENTGTFEPDDYARKRGNIPIKRYKYIVLDESSMVSDALLDEIKKFMMPTAKIIYMGDKAQLPPVGQLTDSKVFDILEKYELTEKMRQAKTSPIINIGTKIAENVETTDENRKPNVIDNSDRQNVFDEESGSSILFEKDLNKALNNFVKDFNENPTDVNHVKIVTFNNQNHNSFQSVKNLNNQVREKLFGDKISTQFLPGELVTSYGSYSIDSGQDVDETIIQNSEDFIVDSARETSVTDTAYAYSAAKGRRGFNYNYNIVALTLKNDEGVIIEHDIPVIANSSKEQYRKDLAALWISDKALAFSLQNEFADIEYGYAITSHKAQGSTYNTVYVMEDNILGPSNGGSIKSKNQSLYVAVSRPKNKLVMVSENNPATQQLKVLPKQELNQKTFVTNAIKNELPIEISDSITVVEEVPLDILDRSDLFLSLKEILNDNNINDEILINWAGVNKDKIDIRNIKSEKQLTNLIEKVYDKNKNPNNHPELKNSKLILESFNNWVSALERFPVPFRERMLSHAVKYLNPQRRSKYVLQLSEVALSQAYGIVVNKPHELNRIGKLYDSEVLKTVSDAVGHEPSASGKGHWVHIPRTSRSYIETRSTIKDLSNDPKAPGKFSVEFIDEIDQDNNIEFFETKEAAEAFVKGLEGEKGSDAQFKVNVELLRKLSPSTWCTSSGMASHYVENFDNYLLIVDGITVAGIEAGGKGSNGKIQVKEVTSRGNNGVASIDHIDDIVSFFEKHNLDTNNNTLNRALKAKEQGKEDSNMFDEYEPDPEDGYYGYERDAFEPEDYGDYYADEQEREREIEIARNIISEVNTIDEALTLVGVNPHFLNNYFYEFDQDLRNDERLATMAVNAESHNIRHINSNTSFYEKLMESAVNRSPYVFNYLPNDIKEKREDLKKLYDAWQAERDLVLDEELPFSKTNNKKIQGYYDAKNDKVVVIANNVSVNEASKVAIHEVAHRGMIRMAKELGGTEELNQVLLSAEKQLMKALPDLLKRTGHKNVEDLAMDYGFDVNSKDGKYKLLNELAARWAETLVDKPKPSWWKEFITSIKNWLTKFTGKTLNEQEVNELVGGFVKYGTKQENKTNTFEKKNILDIKPIQSVDKKATIKASIATQYIGFGEGIPNSSTEAYRQQAGKLANTGNYSSNDVIFVSIGGKRPSNNLELRKSQQDRTIKEAIKALNAGATIITDNQSYIESSDYNEGEKRLFKNLENNKNYEFFEKTIDNQKLGFWKLKENKTNIYNQLGNKTKSEHIIIKSWGELKDATIAVTPEGVISTRIKNTEEHFGNPFSHDPAGKTQGLFKTETIKEAVEKYTDWVINSKDDRANWIREQLKSGKLKGKPILYYKELGEPSHATALDYLINKYNWNNTESQKNNYTWSRFSNNNYEVSSAGDKRFSALYAKLKDGRTIEEAYQLDIKGYRSKGNDWKLGKGKPPINNITKEDQWNQYKNLWKQYLNENPDLEKDLREKANGKVLTDKFASTDVSQARALSEILNETPLESQKTAVGQPAQQSNKRTITNTKKESLVSTEKDEKGNDIEETLTGYMNAIVDMVKNPEVINQSNLNLYTASTAFLLARAGVDRDWTTVFLKQPILVDLVNQMNISESRISQKLKGSDGETLKALDIILKKYGSTKSSREFKEEILKDNLKNEDGFVTITEGELRKEFVNPNNGIQIKVLKQFLEYQTKGFTLADLMTIMSADTDGATKNGTTADMRDNLMMDVIAGNEFTDLPSLLGYDLDENNKPIFNDTRYIGTYHKNSVQLLQKIAKQKFISSSDSFKHAVNTIARYSGHKKLKTKNDEELVKNIENELFAGFIEEAKIVSFNDIEDLKTLLYGNKSKISKILEQKEKDLRELAAYKKQEGSQLTSSDVNYFNKVYDDKIKSLPKNKTLAERVLDAQIEHPDNLFLSALLATENVYNNGKPSTVSLSSKNIDKESKDDLYLYWEDLLNIDKQLAEDLIKYSYYSSGFSPNLGVFFEHIPTSWVIENKLNDYIKGKLTTLNESNMGLLHLKDQVVRHSYKNNSIVPTISDKMLTEFKMGDGGIVPSLYYAVIQDFNASNLEIGENKHGQKEYKTFIKRIYTEPNTNETFTYLYQYKGYGLNKNSESKEIKHLLYERVSPLGTTKGINVIKEYGNNGESIFAENKVTIPPYYKDYIDKLKLIEPLPIELLHDSFDKKDNTNEEPNENDLMYCNIKIN